MGVEFYTCAECKASVNDLSQRYFKCDTCKAVYCYECQDSIKLYGADDFFCVQCDPYVRYVEDSPFAKWLVQAHLPELDYNYLVEEYKETLPEPNELVDLAF